MAVVMVVLVVVMASCNSEVWQVTVEIAMAVVVRMLAEVVVVKVVRDGGHGDEGKSGDNGEDNGDGEMAVVAMVEAVIVKEYGRWDVQKQC